MRSPEGLDLDLLVPWLGARDLIDPARDVQAIRLTGGLSNVTFLVSQGEQQVVVRRPPLGHVMPTAHDMGREFQVISGVTRGGFPAPRATQQEKRTLRRSFAKPPCAMLAG